MFSLLFGSSEKYTSPDATMYKLIHFMHENRNLSVNEILHSIDLDIKYKE